jgi:hypothetical protein
MKLTPADVTQLQFSKSGTRATATVVFNSHYGHEDLNRIDVKIELSLAVSDDATVADLRRRSAEAATALLSVQTAEDPSRSLIEPLSLGD